MNLNKISAYITFEFNVTVIHNFSTHHGYFDLRGFTQQVRIELVKDAAKGTIHPSVTLPDAKVDSLDVYFDNLLWEGAWKTLNFINGGQKIVNMIVGKVRDTLVEKNLQLPTSMEKTWQGIKASVGLMNGPDGFNVDQTGMDISAWTNFAAGKIFWGEKYRGQGCAGNLSARYEPEMGCCQWRCPFLGKFESHEQGSVGIQQRWQRDIDEQRPSRDLAEDA
jgi:hypothetical protein